MLRVRVGVVALGLSALFQCTSPSPAVTQCPVGTVPCGADCARLETDDAHCGSCSNACAAGQRCANSACFESACDGGTCDADSVCSRGACVEKACVGVVCPANKACSNGECVCGAGTTDCSGTCANLSLDDGNCGACGKACPADQACAAGACFPKDCSVTCDALSVCVGSTCQERACVGVACPSGQTCHAGACGCADGEQECNGACVKTATDSMNCGACGTVCPSGTRCAASTCLPTACDGGTCDPLSVCFHDSCMETACLGVSCSGGKTCSAGACGCPAGTVDCGATCASLLSDPLNCNGCGNACGGGRVCVMGACQCPSGATFCGLTCVNEKTDPNNCGGCSKSCNGGTCTNGMCSCPQGQLLCGGTCIPVDADNTNCGVCGNVCPGATYCNGSQCLPMFTCQGNFNAPPSDCPLFPLDSAQCGVQGNGAADPWVATVGPMSPQAVFPFDAGPNELVEIAGALNTSAFIGSLDLLSATSTLMKQQSYNVLTNASFDFVATGSIYPCAHPATARATWTLQQANTQVNGHVFHHPFSGKYNTGGTMAGSASVLASDPTSGRVCDQVCGDVKNVCGDDREHYRFTLPARTGAVIEAAVASGGAPDAGSTFNLVAANGAGGTVCNLVSNGLVTSDPGAFRARIVNNTGSPQIVTIYPQAISGPLRWNFAVGVEK